MANRAKELSDVMQMIPLEFVKSQMVGQFPDIVGMQWY